MKEIEPIKPLEEAQADWTFKSGQRCTSARLLLSNGYVSKLKRIPANCRFVNDVLHIGKRIKDLFR